MGINSLIDNGIGLAKANPLGTAAGIGAVGLGSGLVVGSILGSKAKGKTRKSRSKSRRNKHTKRGWKQDRKRFNKHQKWEVAYRKRKMKRSRSSRKGKIHYARKTGQPYIILASGKAKFIKGKRRK